MTPAPAAAEKNLKSAAESSTSVTFVILLVSNKKAHSILPALKFGFHEPESSSINNTRHCPLIQVNKDLILIVKSSRK